MTQPGMFSDGVLYASIARNMAEGHGSFWRPEYTKTIYPVFAEHPPLGLGLEAALFRAAGDHPFVERLYSLIAAGATAALIVALWRCAGPDPRGDWLPLIFWLLPSIVTWSVINNMLENTQAVFTTAAVLCGVLAMRARPVLWGGLSAVAIAAAVLTKGPVGFFPLCVPIGYAVVVYRRALPRALAVSAGILAILALVAAVLTLNKPAHAYMRTYLTAQVMASLAGAREAAASRWRFARLFGLDVIIRMGLLLVVIWALARRVTNRDGRGWPIGSQSLFFLCVGLTASLPIAISPKLMGHYLVPSVPMFALAASCAAWPLIVPGFDAADSNTLSRRRLLVGLPGAAGFVLIIAALVVPVARGPLEERDVGRLGALDLIGPSLKAGDTVSTCPEANSDWPLHAYLQRFFHVSVDAGPTPHRVFLRVTDRPCAVPTGCALTRFARDLEIYACSRGTG
jgi:4-amino-4-deoxy-L-arabinose transferase-like glycosyltransferase